MSFTLTGYHSDNKTKIGMRSEEEIIKYVHDEYPELGRISRCKIAMQIFAKEQSNKLIDEALNKQFTMQNGVFFESIKEFKTIETQVVKVNDLIKLKNKQT